MTVRPRSAGDIPSCVDALAEVHSHDQYPTRWPEDPAEWLTPAHLLGAWVAADAVAVHGHVAVVADVEDGQVQEATGRPAAELAMLSRLFVRPAARGRGLGEALLVTVVAFAAQRNVSLVLKVVDERRSAAIALYEQLGGQLVGRRTAGWVTPAGERPELRIYVLPRFLPGK